MQNTQSTLVKAQAIGDTALATGAISSPVWLAYLSDWLGILAAVGGLVILAARGWLIWRDIQKARAEDKKKEN